MKKILKIMLYIYLSVNIFSETTSTLKYTDITSEHWAYKSIENLTKKGILDISSNVFNGEKAINRFDMAYFLSKTLDRVENDKADRADLIVIEHIVYEFSEELSKFGFDSQTYLKKVDTFEAKLEENRVSNEENKKNLLKLETKLDSLEKDISRKNQFITSDSSISDKLSFLNDITFYLKSNIDYNINDTSENNSFKGAHQLGIALKKNTYELFLESETSDKERKNGELLVKGQVESEVVKGYSLNFHTSDYERYINSHFNNVIYDNHNSYTYVENKETDNEKTYQYDSFDSYGLALANENMGIYVEKTRTDYDGKYAENDAYGVTVNDSFSDTFNFITKFDYKYFEAMALKNGNNENMDFEITAKYPIKKFEAALAYSEKRGTNRVIAGTSVTDEDYNLLKFNKLQYLNGEMVYGGKSNFTLGFESKFNESEKLYTAYTGSYKYNLTENGKIKYKYEYINRDSEKKRRDFQNHYIMVNIYGEKLNTYAAFNLISLNKKYYVNNTNEDYYDIEKDYKETLIKSTYIINPKALFKIGYLVREMNETSKKNEISFVQGQYKVNNSALVFVKYIKNTGEDFSDRRLDADNNMIDLDFDSSTGVIREAAQGRIEFGIELVF